jgi:hypothetical protein
MGSSRPNRRISSSVGSKTCPNVGRQSWIIEKNTKFIDCLIICVKNKLFGSVKKPYERMHQSNTSETTFHLRSFKYISALSLDVSCWWSLLTLERKSCSCIYLIFITISKHVYYVL